MRSFFFKEARLLEMRKQQVWIAEQKVSLAAADVAAVKDVVNADIARLESLYAHLRLSPQNALTHLSRTVLGMRSRLEASQARLAEFEQALEIATQDWQLATRNVEALEVLKSRQAEKHQKKVQKEAQAVLDSFSIHKWVKERSAHD